MHDGESCTPTIETEQGVGVGKTLLAKELVKGASAALVEDGWTEAIAIFPTETACVGFDKPLDKAAISELAVLGAGGLDCKLALTPEGWSLSSPSPCPIHVVLMLRPSVIVRPMLYVPVTIETLPSATSFLAAVSSSPRYGVALAVALQTSVGI